MPPIDDTRLRLRGVSEALIQEYVNAAEAAWADAALKLQAKRILGGDRPLMAQRLEIPLGDRQRVSVTIGTGGQFGAVSATNPTSLRAALARHLGERFA